MLRYRNILSVVVISMLVLAMAVNAQDAPVGRGGAGAPGGRGAAAPGRGMRGMRGGRGAAVRSPEIADDNTVTFRISAPDANSVTVSGDFFSIPANILPEDEAADSDDGASIDLVSGGPARGRGGMGGRGGTQMTKDPNGLWSVTIGPLNSELYGYTFNVDGASVWDPANMQLKRDGTRIQSVVIVPGGKGDFYTIKDVPHGTLAKVWYDSPTLNLNRRLYVYTPPGYETSGESYPVLYLLHGAGGDEDAWTSLGRTPQILDNLIAEGKAEPMIVVMTNGNGNQTSAPDARPAGAGGNRGGMMRRGAAPAGERGAAPARGETAARGGRGGGFGGGPSFPESLALDVVPFIEKSYRVLADSEHRAIAGLSMGGGHTISATLSHPEVFGYIGVFSGLIRNLNEESFDALAEADPILYYVACGENDPTCPIANSRALVDVLNSKGINNKTFWTTGGHAWYNWRIYLTELAPLLFK